MKKYLYFVRVVNSKTIKIGVTDDMSARIRILQGGNPKRLEVLGVIESPSDEAEMAAHRYFANDRIRGEWFKETPELLHFISAHSEEWQGHAARGVDRIAAQNAIDWEAIVTRGQPPPVRWGSARKRYAAKQTV